MRPDPAWERKYKMPGGSNFRSPRGFLTEEEKQNMPKVTWPLIKRILSYLKPYWPQFLLGFVLILVSAVVGLFPSIVTGWIVNEMTGLDKSIMKLVWLLLFWRPRGPSHCI